jgi:streptogramin lyase
VATSVGVALAFAAVVAVPSAGGLPVVKSVKLDAGPAQVVTDHAGDVWVSELPANEVARVTEKTGAVRQFPVPSGTGGSPLGLFLQGSDLLVGLRGGVGDLNTTTGAFTVTPVAGSRFVSFAANGTGQVFGTDSLGDRVFELQPGGSWTPSWTMPSGCGAGGIATDGGSVFVGCLKLDVVDEYGPGGASIGSFAMPPPSTGPEELQRGPDGRIYGTLFNGGGIFQLNPGTHSVTVFRASTTRQTEGIVFGAPGKVDFTDYGAGFVGQLDVTKQTITTLAVLPGGSKPAGIAIDGGTTYVAENGANALAEITEGTTTPCECTRLTALIPPKSLRLYDPGKPTNKVLVAFDLTWRMFCSAGDGGCKGKLVLVPPKGFDAQIDRKSVYTIECDGECGGKSSGTEKHVSLVTNARLSGSHRGKDVKSITILMHRYCQGGKESDRTFRIAFDGGGKLDLTESDLNGDGKPDG